MGQAYIVDKTLCFEVRRCNRRHEPDLYTRGNFVSIRQIDEETIALAIAGRTNPPRISPWLGYRILAQVTRGQLSKEEIAHHVRLEL
ncbi:MAG: hypothetical protein PHR51_00485 [Patescibacteria group bacterium]|nr:hypothetical protein [Patescibacteria group bacterium]